jgi:hypothetical protein
VKSDTSKAKGRLRLQKKPHPDYGGVAGVGIAENCGKLRVILLRMRRF